MIKTKCDDCIFANINYAQQTGCELGFVEKFIERGEATLNEITRFYEINRLCRACRNSDWAKEKEDGYVAIEEELRIKYSLIIVENCIDDIEDIYFALNDTLQSIIKQKNMPEKIVICISNPEVNRVEFSNKIKLVFSAFENNGFNVKYCISFIIDTLSTTEEIVDIGFTKTDTMFYTVVQNGFELPENFSDLLDKLINKDLEKVVMVKGFDGFNGETYLSAAHTAFRGNRELSLKEKIEGTAEGKGVFQWI
jgi:hypothetical protein